MQKTTTSATISGGKTRGKTWGDGARLQRQFERLTADAISEYGHRQHIGDVCSAATVTYSYPLAGRTQRRWHLPQVMNPFTRAEATHLEVVLTLEDGGATWEARLSWIVPSVPQPDMTVDEAFACSKETIRLSWIGIACEGARLYCFDFIDTWRDPALFHYAQAALSAASSGLLEVPAPLPDTAA